MVQTLMGKMTKHQLALLAAACCLQLAQISLAQNDAVSLDSAAPAAAAPSASAVELDDVDCPQDQVSFEMVTGYVYTAPSDMLDSQPGTLMLTDCIATCARNSSCKSINYETGLCVLFSSSADDNSGELTPSQYPVFTIYLQKTCLASAADCKAAWSYERVMDHALDVEPMQIVQEATNRQDCMEACLAQPQCRAINWVSESAECNLLNVDRQVMAGRPAFQAAQGVDLLEKNCIEPGADRLCLYETVKGKILKTVDSVYQAIDSKEDCEDLCNNAPFRCHSFDFNDTGDNVCRLSHHSAHTLTQITDPYLAIEEATTYELSACYNVSINCFSGDMRANIHTTTMFKGKVYAKGSPLTCVEDINDKLDFSINFGYNDLECGVVREREGSYTNDVIIQHHDRIVTEKDLGLSVTCEYDLSNKTVASAVDLKITGEIAPSLFEESLVDSPNVVMRVADQQGQDTKTAVVGDPLSMLFEILDIDSPYEIFVRDLIALDGASDNELLLIDERGCPVEPTIMSELRKAEGNPKILISNFDAFRFPSSDMVQFRALVTPCMPTCAPVQCDVLDYTGQTETVDSYGRRRRKRSALSMTNNFTEVATTTNYRRAKRMASTYSSHGPEDVMVLQTLHIVDKMGRRRPQQQQQEEPSRVEQTDSRGNRLINRNQISRNEVFVPSSSSFDIIHQHSDSSRCIDTNSLIAGSVMFLVAQVLLLVLWILVWRRKRSKQAKEVVVPDNSTDSLSHMYETGYSRRLQNETSLAE